MAKQKTAKTGMTHLEANVGIGRQVREIETGQVGQLMEVRHRQNRNYYQGLVDFPDVTRWIWLQKLEWIGGPPPTPNAQPARHKDVINAISRIMTERKPEPLFRLLFHREPTNEEKKAMRGKLVGICPRCKHTLYAELMPNGTAQFEDCYCGMFPFGAEDQNNNR